MSTDGVRHVALHEAAHAVVRYLYGSWNPDHTRRFKDATVVPTDDYRGQVSGHAERWMLSPTAVIDMDYADIGGWDARTRRRVEHTIMVTLAGSVCEDLFGLEETDATVPFEMSDGQVVDIYVGGASSDLQTAYELAGLVGGSDETRSAFIEWLRLRTYDFLNQQHVLQAVEALANALVDRGTLNYREATAVIDEAVLDRSRVAAFAERLQSK